MVSIFRRLFGGGKQESNPPATSLTHGLVELSVGDRVRDAWSNEGTITEINPDAEHGLGAVNVQFDDGRETSYALAASGLEKIRSRSFFRSSSPWSVK